MIYELEFNAEAMKEWKKLDATIRQQFKKQLEKRILEPHVPSARLHGTDMHNVYKIKLRDLGYRLVYEVNDQTITILVLAIGKREKNQVHELVKKRLK